MWHGMLTELRTEMAVHVLGVGGKRARLWRPHVWLQDGHRGPLPVKTPWVAALYEATWDRPDTRELLDPVFVSRHEMLSRAAALRASRIVTLSESSRRQIIESYGVQPARVLVARPGVDHRVFRPDARGGPEVIARAGGDPGRPYVLFVSQLHPRKNLPALQTAMSRLTDRGHPHMLVVVASPRTDSGGSDATESRELEAMILPELDCANGSILRLESLTDEELAAVMTGASAFCLPSLMEGFGLPALEAMACGTPVVVSDRGALPEVVGDGGIITAPKADAIEEALEAVFADEAHARTLGVAGLERSRDFTWRATAHVWLRAIHEAIADAG
jgi:glycosyltransferase involved in cell wall biosynthesis